MKSLRTIFATVVAGIITISLTACGNAATKPSKPKSITITEINLKSVSKACKLNISHNNMLQEIAMGFDSGDIQVEKDAYYKKALCVATIMAPEGVNATKAINTMKSKENDKDADHSIYFRKNGYEVNFFAIGEKANDGSARRYFSLYNSKDYKEALDKLSKDTTDRLKNLSDGSDHNDTNK